MLRSSDIAAESLHGSFGHYDFSRAWPYLLLSDAKTSSLETISKAMTANEIRNSKSEI